MRPWKKATKEKVPKKQTLRQVIATQLLEGGAEAFENVDNEGPGGPGANGLGAAPKGGKSYVEEQADLKKAWGELTLRNSPLTHSPF